MKYYVYAEDFSWVLYGPFSLRHLAHRHIRNLRSIARKHSMDSSGTHYEVVSEVVANRIDCNVMDPKRSLGTRNGS